MNDTKSIITSIILGYAIFALFFTVRVAILLYYVYLSVTPDIFATAPPISPSLNQLSSICLCIAILGSLIAWFGITGLPKSADKRYTTATKYLIAASICSIVGTASYTLAINGCDGALITITYIVSLIFNAAFNAFGYNTLFEDDISSKKREAATRYLILANKTYIAAFMLLLSILFVFIFNTWAILICIFAALYLIHWVLFFVGWSKVRASFSVTVPPQNLAQ